MNICAIRPLIGCQKTIEAMIESKKMRLEEIINYYRNNEFFDNFILFQLGALAKF